MIGPASHVGSIGWALQQEVPDAVSVAARRTPVIPREVNAGQGVSGERGEARLQLRQLSTDSSSHQSGPAQPASSPTCEPPAGQTDYPSGAQPVFLESQHPVTAEPGMPPALQPLRRLPLAAVGEVSADSGGRWEQREVEVSVGADAVSLQATALWRATAAAEEEPPRQVTRPPDGRAECSGGRERHEWYRTGYD